MRPLRATVSRSALRHNLATLRACAPKSRVMAVVKANGYGHGLLRATRGLAASDGFAVLAMSEALELRAAGYRQRILLLEGVFEAGELAAAATHDLTLVVHHEAQLRMLEEARLPAAVAVFAKLNSGMNRLGFAPECYAAAVARLTACRNVSGVTLMSHFAEADAADGVVRPLAVFQRATATLPHPVSLANSAALLRHPETHGDWVRPGIALYGASPFAGECARDFGLRPVMTLQSAIIARQTLQAGEGVGYGQSFVAERATRVGIVACGYADGYPRHAPTGTPVIVDGVLSRTLGRVSMDMMAVDLGAIDTADVGSPVELWGENLAVDAVAEAAGTIGYELLCALAPRVPVQEIE